MAITDGGENEALEELPEPADPPFLTLLKGICVQGYVLNGVSLPEIFAKRAVVMRNIPKCSRDAYVAAVRVSIHEILDGKASGNIQRKVCGWKLFFLAAQVVVGQVFEGRSGVEAEVTRAHGLVGTQAAVRKRRQHVQDDISRRAGRGRAVGVVGRVVSWPGGA